MSGALYILAQVIIAIIVVVAMPHVVIPALIGGVVIYYGFYWLARWLGFFKKDRE